MERNRSHAVFTLTRCGVLSAMAAALYAVEIPVAAFYRLDVSTLPAILACFAMGPAQGLAVVIVKNLVHLLGTASAGIGELADMIVSGAFAVAAGRIYQRDRTRRGAHRALLAGTALRTVAGMLANWLLLIPAYQVLMGMRAEDILAMGTAVHPGIDSIWKLVVFIAGPFNLLKGGVLSALTAVMYKRISPLLHEGTAGPTERKST